MKNIYAISLRSYFSGFLVFIFFIFQGANSNAQTSWKGTTSTNWSTASNWTNGIPSATTDVFIGDANFTGSFQPTLTATSYFNNLTVGGAVAATLTVPKTLTGTAGLTINSNGTITHTASTITVKTSWTNMGTYTGTASTVVVKFGGTSTVNGNATAFQKVTINSGYTVTLNTNISIATLLTVSGTLIPAENATPYVVSGAGGLTVNSSGTIKVNASTYSGNYTLSGTVMLAAGSTVEYSATTINQTVSQNFTYSTLRISGAGTVKTPAANLPDLNSSATSRGNVYVTSGTFDISTYTVNRGTTVASGTFSISNGAFLKIGGTNGFPANYSTITFGASSTVEYYGTNQTIIAKTYGNLTMTSSSGAAVKTMPATAFTVAGNLTMAVGSGTSVSFTEAAAVTITGSLNLGASTTFNASTFSSTIAGSIANDGTLNGGTATITLSGAGSSLSGSGAYNFYGLTITGVNVTTTAAANITLNGTLSTSGSGTFIPASGETVTMAGTSKTISGTGCTLSNLAVSGTITSSTSFVVNGNLSVTGSLSSTGTITFGGSASIISGAGTIAFAVLSVTGNVTATSNFNLSTTLNITGSLTSTSGTVTFTGTSTLNGTANLYNVTLNGTSLTLSTNSILGIASTYTLTGGTLNVTSTIPNTVNYNGTGAQNVTSGTYNNLTFSNGNTKTAAGVLSVNGDITISSSTTFAAGSFAHNIYGNWINNGTLTPGTGSINLLGSSNTTISGATTFNTLTLNKSSSSTSVTLLSDISVPVLNMTSGNINTGSKILTITNTRTGPGIILGTIQRTNTFTTGVPYAFEGADNTINFTAVSGVTSIKVKVTIGSVATFPFGGSINRLYDITIPSGTYTADLRLHYEDAELNGNDESSMQTWNYSGSVWSPAGKSSNSTTQNYVEQTGLTNIAKLWTLSDDANLVRWNGSVSSDWSTAANWSSIQGSPSLPPSANDIAEIGTAAFTNQPVISTSATAKSIKFGSVQVSTLSLTTGGSLTVQGNISGDWTANASHTINVNGQTMTVNGDVVMSDGTANHNININIGTGTLNVTGSVTQSGTASMIFTNSGILNIGQNYTYTAGTFTGGTGTVRYNGTGSQSVGGIPYNNITIVKTSGTAAINSAVTVSGNLLVTAGQLDLNAALTVSGDVTISSGATLNNNSVTTSVGGNWNNNGTYNASSSSVVFNGAGAQAISATTFNNIIISKTSGTASLSGNITLNGNFTITSGTLDLVTYTANRSSAGGSLTMASGTSLLVGGTNNFPLNFGAYALNTNSTVTYNGSVSQSVAGVTYGNLVFSNGGSNPKILTGSTVVNGNLSINSGATFSTSTYNLDLYGNWTNSGTFTPSTGTVLFDGSAKTITGNTTFYKATVSGSYTAANDLTFTNTFTISTGGTFNGGANVITLSGDLVNNGTFTSTGTVTFSGTVSQNIQLSNTLPVSLSTVNFNGTVSPVFTSVSSITFSTVNINNTAGVAPDLGWTVSTAFNVSSGSTFTGGNVTHNINGSFTNNGTVSSSGILNFAPLASQTIQLKGTSFSSTGTIVFGGTGLITVTGTPNTLTNVTIANSNGVSPSASWTIGGNFTINSGAIFNAGSYIYAVGGDILSNGTLNGGTSVFSMSSATGQVSGNETTTFYDFTVTGTIAAIADFNIAHTFTNNGTLDASVGTPFFTGSAAGSITGSAASFALSQFSILKDAGVSVTLAKNITGVTDLEIITGILNTSTFTITKSASGGELDIADNSTLRIGGTNSLPTFTSYSLDTLSNVEYAGAAQAISSATPYGNLIISSAGNKTASAALNIINNFTLTNGTFVPGSFVDTLGGSWSMTSGSFTNTGNTVYLNSTGNQGISSTGAFNNLKINKSAGSASLATDITVNGTLTFVLGGITTGTNKLIIPSGGAISGAGASTGWVKGNLQKYYSTAAATFEVGGSTYYSPVSFTFSGLTAGSLIVSATGSVHPNIATSAIQSNRSIARYWTLSLPSGGAIAFTGSTATFNWNTADNYSPITATLEKLARYSSSTWTYPAVSGTPTTSSIQTTAITSSTLGDFTVGETCNVSSGFTYAGTPYCSTSGTATITLTGGGTAGTFTASPAGLSINSSTGAITLSTSTAGTYTITNTATGTGGCTSISMTSITITAAPSATISYSGSPYCSTSGTASVTRTGTAGGTYSSTTGLIIDSGTGDIILGTSTSGTYTVTYSVAASGGCSLYTTLTSVTVTAAPSAIISYAGTPYCSTSGTASVSRTGTSGGTYSSTTGLSINSSTGDITLGTSTAGTYTVTYTVAASGGCSLYTTTTSVTVTAAPSASISYAGTPYCSNSGTATVTRTGTSGGTYSSTTGLSINSSTGDITLGTSTAGTYTVTYTVAASGGCSLYTTTTSVTVTAAPSASISYAGTPYCSNSGTASVTRTGTSGGTYSSTTGLSINFSTGDITLGTSTAGTYTVTYSVAASGGCSLYTTLTSVTVTAAPSAIISYAGTPYCSTSGTASVSRTGTSGGTYSSTTGLSINSSTGDITLGTSTAGTYTVTYTVAASGGCSLYTTTTSVTVTAAPSASISYAGTPYCSNSGTATVTRTGTSGGTYSSTTGLSINSSTGDITLGTSTAGTYTVTYTVAASGGCSLYTTTTSVTINTAPSATISYAGTPYCSSAGTVSVTRTGTSGGTYSSTTGLSINSSTGDITLAISTAGTYTVTYTVAASGGCSLYTATTSVTITPAPSAMISYAGSPYCSNGSTASVTRTGTSGGTYSSTTGLSINSSTGDITLGTSTAGTYIVTYTVAASGGCSLYTTTTSVIITAAPSASISYAGTPYCSNSGTASVTRTGTSGGTYSSTTGLSINSSTGDITLGTSTAGTYTVTYTVAASGGCSLYTTTTSVTINTAPSATISYAGTPYCSSAGTVSVTRTGTSGGTYSSTTGLSINSSTGDITLAISTAGTYTVTYTVAASGGCSLYTATTSVTITPAPSAMISYAGSPYCSNGSTASVTRTGTSGGTYSSTTGLSINSSTGDITLGTSTPGTYTVTYLVGASGGCSSYSTTAGITITPAPSAAISYAGSPYCSNSGTASVSLSGTAGGTYSSTSGLIINSSTGDVTLGASTAGTYTVTYLVSAYNGCSAYSTTADITINEAPYATISYAGSPYCSDGGTASVTRSGTRGGTYSSTTGLSISATTGLIDLAASDPGNYTVTYTIEAVDPCGQFQTTTTINIQTAGVWTGAISTDWNDGGNWLCGAVPSATANILIQGSLPHYPIISVGTSSINSLDIENNTSLTVNGGTLQIAGTIINTGSFNVNNGTIELNGISPQTIDNTTFTGNTVYNLVISNDVTLTAEDSITGTLSFGASDKTFTTNGFLTLKSTATGTARLADITNAGANSGNDITGDVHVEKFIQARRAWRLLTAPINSASTQTIHQAWQENQTSGNLIPGFGTEITGGTTAAGFDQSPSNSASMKRYSSGQWVAATSTNIPIISDNGYFVFIRGDRSIDLNSRTSAAPTTTVLRSTGELKMNDQSFSVAAAGYSVVSNPFTSAIDLNNVAKSNSINVQDNFYVWDPMLTGSHGLGGYVNISWNGTSYDITPSTGGSGVTQYIQSGSAFLAASADGVSAGALTIKETDKTDLGNNISRPANSPGEKLVTNLYSVNTDKSATLVDGSLNRYGNTYSNAVDKMDAVKINNLSENLAIQREGKSLIVERRQPVNSADTIFLKISQMKKASYRLEFIAQDMAHPGLNGFVEDSYLKTSTPLNLNGSIAIDFSITSVAASSQPDRFRIVFRPLAPLPVTIRSVKATKQNNNINVQWNVENEINIKQYEVEKSVNGENFSSSQIIKAIGNNIANSYNWLDQHAMAGDNFYRIKVINGTGETQNSQIVKVNFNNGKQEIIVHSTFLTNNIINFELVNMPAGNYWVRLLSTLGQTMYSRQFSHAQGSSSEALQLKTVPAKGIYMLEIIKPDKKILTQKIFIKPL